MSSYIMLQIVREEAVNIIRYRSPWEQLVFDALDVAVGSKST